MIGIIQPTLSNAMTLPVPDGYIQSQVHPSVVHIPEKWNGYEFWMASTPWGSNDEENPCVYFANKDNEGNIPLEWQALTSNPIIPKPLGVGEYNADCELVFDNNANNGLGKMYMLWKDTSIVNSSTGIKVGGWRIIESDNGEYWYNNRIVKYGLPVSLCHYKNSNKYIFYFINSIANDIWGASSIFKNLEKYEISDLSSFNFYSKGQICSVELSSNYNPWHGCVIKYKNKIYFIANAYPHKESADTKTFIYESSDGNVFKQFTNKSLCEWNNPYRPYVIIDETDNKLHYFQAIMGLPKTSPSITQDGKAVCLHSENADSFFGKLK